MSNVDLAPEIKKASEGIFPPDRYRLAPGWSWQEGRPTDGERVVESRENGLRDFNIECDDLKLTNIRPADRALYEAAVTWRLGEARNKDGYNALPTEVPEHSLPVDKAKHPAGGYKRHESFDENLTHRHTGDNVNVERDADDTKDMAVLRSRRGQPLAYSSAETHHPHLVAHAMTHHYDTLMDQRRESEKGAKQLADWDGKKIDKGDDDRARQAAADYA